MIASPLSPSWDFPWIRQLQIIPLSRGFAAGWSKKAMVQHSSALLAQLRQHGVTINEGIAAEHG